MILIIVAFILSLITMAIISVETGDGVQDPIVFKFKPKCLFGFLWLLIILFGCFVQIGTGEVGIKTRFGKVVDASLSEGLNFKLPFEDVKKINVKVQKYENEQALSSSTKDMQIVENVKITVNYQVNSKKAPSLYREVGVNYLNAIMEPAIQETVKAVISKYTAGELVTKRSAISLDINDTLNNKIKDYGINAVSTAINNFDFSKAYNEAIEKKAVAEQEVETAKNKQEKAKIEADTKIIEAQGEADANKKINESLSDQVLKDKFIDKWDGHLPTVTGGDALLDVSGLLK